MWAVTGSVSCVCSQEVYNGVGVCAKDLERVLETGRRLTELLTSKWSPPSHQHVLREPTEKSTLSPVPESKASMSSLMVPKDPSNALIPATGPSVPLQCRCFLPGLLPLAAGDQAQLVRQQLDHFQERVRLTESQVACAQQKLLYAQRTASSRASPPAGSEAQLELEGSASAHPGLKDQKQVLVPP